MKQVACGFGKAVSGRIGEGGTKMCSYLSEDFTLDIYNGEERVLSIDNLDYKVQTCCVKTFGHLVDKTVVCDLR